MTESATIVMRLPPACLSPNRPPASRRGRFAKAAATKKYRKEAREAMGHMVDAGLAALQREIERERAAE